MRRRTSLAENTPLSLELPQPHHTENRRNGVEVPRLIAYAAHGIGDTDRIARDDAACRTELTNARAELAAEPPSHDPVALHPMKLDGYRRDLEDLAPRMGADHRDNPGNCAQILRRIIDSVEISEGPDGQLVVTVHGRLRQMIEAPPLPDRVLVTLVAREGLEPSTLRL